MFKDLINNGDIELKIPTSEEIRKKSSHQLNQFKNNGSIIEITELAILTGALWYEAKSPVYDKIYAGDIITRSCNEYRTIKYIDSDGKEVSVDGCKSRYFTIVPVIMPSQELWDKLIKNKLTIKSCNYELHKSFEEDIIFFGELEYNEWEKERIKKLLLDLKNKLEIFRKLVDNNKEVKQEFIKLMENYEELLKTADYSTKLTDVNELISIPDPQIELDKRTRKLLKVKTKKGN